MTSRPIDRRARDRARMTVTTARRASRSPRSTWGDPDDRPLLLVHGVTASAAIWWRVGPAPRGHRPTRGRRGPARPRADGPLDGSTSRSARPPPTSPRSSAAPGSTAPDLQVIGHSWGAMVRRTCRSPGSARRRSCCSTRRRSRSQRHRGDGRRPDWRTYDDLAEASRRSRRRTRPGPTATSSRPRGADEPVEVAAAALGRRSTTATGMPARRARRPGRGRHPGLARPRRARGRRPAPGRRRGRASAARYGADHVITIPGAPHSPQRTHLEATVAAFERALAS